MVPVPIHIVWKLLKMSHLNFWILAFSTNFCPIKPNLSGYTVWPQVSGYQKLAKMDHFWYFQLTFVHSKCKGSSLRSQCWMRLFLWFSNTVNSQAEKNFFGRISKYLVKVATWWKIGVQSRPRGWFMTFLLLAHHPRHALKSPPSSTIIYIFILQLLPSFLILVNQGKPFGFD